MRSAAVRHCLIVDDSAVIRKVARRILDGAGYYVSEASSGAEGWRLCRNTKPNVLLLDYILPDMGAIEFIEALRRSNAAPLPQILLCTPYLDVPRIMKAKRAGAAGYVMKPFDKAQLLGAFEHQLGQAKAA
jgi:two-component system, chemotaxis family, chemotaxis protein CheY